MSPRTQVGSFNYAMDKIVFKDEFIPTKEDAVRSILDYAINIFPLAEEEKQVMMTLSMMVTMMVTMMVAREGG